MNKVNRFQALFCTTNNSSKHQSFVYTQLNDQTVLFQTIQFSRSHFFALNLNVKIVLFDPQLGPYHVLSLRAKLNLGAMAMKGYSVFPKAPALLEPHQKIVSCQIRDTSWGALPLCRDTVIAFYSPSRLSSITYLYQILFFVTTQPCANYLYLTGFLDII